MYFWNWTMVSIQCRKIKVMSKSRCFLVEIHDIMMIRDHFWHFAIRCSAHIQWCGYSCSSEEEGMTRALLLLYCYSAVQYRVSWRLVVCGHGLGTFLLFTIYFFLVLLCLIIEAFFSWIEERLSEFQVYHIGHLESW